MTQFVIHSVEGNRQRLDGGAMFGNAPKAMWEQWLAPDERNRIPLACRSFLIVDQQSGQHILLDAGVGAFLEPKLRERYGVTEPEHVLLESLAQLGVAPQQIDVVVLSHLHFDHAGGILSEWQANQPPRLVFTRAKHLVSRTAWQRAKKPHLRDRASFFAEITGTLEQSNQLEIVEQRPSTPLLGRSWELIYSDGHTPGMMLAHLRTAAGSAAFCADLIPGMAWAHLPITMGYDRFPELLIEEKKTFLEASVQQNTLLLSTHDPNVAAFRVALGDKGRFTTREAQTSLSGWTL